MTGERRTGLNLKRKAALFISATLIVTIGLTTTVLVLVLLPRLRNSLLTSSSLIGSNLVREIKRTVDLGVALDQMEGLAGKLNETVSQYPDLGYVLVTGRNGVPLFRSTDAPEALPDTVPRELAADAGVGKPYPSVLIVTGTGSYYNTTLPIVTAEGVAGAVHVGIKSRLVVSQVNAVAFISLIVGLFGFAVSAMVMTLFVNRTISQPLEDLAATARAISAGSLQAPALTGRRDEIGELAEAFATMVHSLSQVVGRSLETSRGLEQSAGELTRTAEKLSQAFSLQVDRLDHVAKSLGEMDRQSGTLAAQSRDLAGSAGEASSTITETTTAIGEINRTMSEITAAVETISSAILEMSTTVREVAEGAESTAVLAGEARQSISRINAGIQNVNQLSAKSLTLSKSLRQSAAETGSTSVRETLLGIRSIQDEVVRSNEGMKILRERVENIGDIIQVIDEIADQTNLLALNASIISAQAGEHGRAFAVVAGEIRELSTRTSDSTRKIAELIKGVQGEAANYASSLGRVVSSVKQGLQLGQEAESALVKIVEGAEESSKMATVIDQVNKEQSAASVLVSESVDIFARRAEEIKQATQEERQGADFIRDAMERTKLMVGQVYRATEEQNRGTRMLAVTSEKTKSVSSELSQVLDRQQRSSREILTSLENLKGITSTNFQTIKSLTNSAAMMTDLASTLKATFDRFRAEPGGGESGHDRPLG
jgi:methyl-accepting chemotaxis protein